MNIKKITIIDSTVNLNESQQFQQPAEPTQEVNTDLEEIVLKTKSKQFQFDCGVFMANINTPIKSRFGLQWHFDNTKSVEDFITSVSKFIAVSENVLSKHDISMLTKQYERYSKKQ